jgi:protein-tyrosine phosphatase
VSRHLDGWYGLGGGSVRPMRPGLDAILPELLVGEYPRVEDLAWLRDEHGVTAVVSLQDDADLASKRLDVADLERACAELGLAFERLPVADGDPDGLATRLPALVARLHALIDGGARVYLHCNAGYNRAPTAAIAYLHVHRAMALDAACEEVKARRSCVPYVTALRQRYGDPASRRRR